MARPAQDITESELSILRILWDRGPATIRQLTDVLYPRGAAAQYATVQKLLDRMEAKGYVGRDRSLYVHVFAAALDRDELIGRRLRSLAETLCDGSMTPLLTHLARAKDLTDADRLALRAIVEETEDEPSEPEGIQGGPPTTPIGTCWRERRHDALTAIGESARRCPLMDLMVHGMLSNAAAVAVLAVLIAVAGRVCRRPALIHSLCLLAMLKLVTPPVVSLPMPVPAAATWPAPVLPDDPVPDVMNAEPAEAPPIVEDFDEEFLAEPSLDHTLEASAQPASGYWSWEPIALGLVLAGALAWWALAAVRIVRFHRLLRDVEPMPAEWQAEIGELAGRLGLRRPPTACLVPGDVPPMLWAIGPRARLLVPARLWSNLGDDERTSLLLHELAHLRRRDHWVRWGELAIAGLYWWHPAVWWIRRALREAEEQCCDAWVVWAMPRGARTYAAALVAAIEFVSGVRTVPPAAASATLGNGHVSSLKRRLRMIVKARTPKGLSWAGRLAVAGLSALLLPLAPSWGQKDGTRAEKGDALGVSYNSDAETPYQKATAELFATDLQLIEAKAALEKAQANRDAAEPLEDRIREEFKNDPDVQPLIEKIVEAREELKRSRALTRRGDDPSVIALQRQLDKVTSQWNELWEQKKDEIAARVKAIREDQRPGASEQKVKEIEATIGKLNMKRASLTGMIKELEGESTRKNAGRSNLSLKDNLEKELDKLSDRIKKTQAELTALVERGNVVVKDGPPAEARAESAKSIEKSKGARGDQLRASMLNQDLAYMRRLQEAVKQRLAQLEFGAGDDEPRKAKQSDEGDKPKQARTREATERIEKELKALKEKLGRDLSPVGDEVRKSLERTLDEIQQSLKKEGMTAEDLRRAVEKSRNEMRESLKRGGPVEKEMRLAAERARKDMQEAMERSMKETERFREEFGARMREAREEQKKATDQQHKAMQEQMRRQAERMRDMARARQEERKSARGKSERPKAEAGEREKAELGEAGREDLDAARKEIRELQERLRAANRRLELLQRQSRRTEPPARRGRSESPRAVEPPARPATPATPARPAEPARPVEPRRPATPARPAEPRRPAPAARDDYERRFRELDDKLDRLLKELQEIKSRSTPGTRAVLSR